MSMSRDQLIERIRKLFALAADAGATFEEASTAARKARELMREYGIDQIDVAAAEMARKDVPLNRAKRSRVDELVVAIAYATGTVPTMVYGVRSLAVEYFGPDPAPTIAAYLHDHCYRAVDYEAKRFRSSPEYLKRRKPNTRAAALRAFRSHMVLVLRNRLLRLGWMTSDERARLSDMRKASESCQLVTMRQLKKRGAVGRYADAATAGAIAGSTVAINQGVGANQDGRALLTAGAK